MNYFSLAKYLQEKYGLPNGNYFLSESCASTNKSIKRIGEGLYIHHIAEYNEQYPLANNLSSSEDAKRFPFKFQTPQYLCYCNAIEHIILHYHIHRLRTKSVGASDDGLVHYMFPEIRAWYVSKGDCINKDWKYNAWLSVKDDERTFQELYALFYKEFPKEPRYSYKEYLMVERHNKLKR